MMNGSMIEADVRIRDPFLLLLSAALYDLATFTKHHHPSTNSLPRSLGIPCPAPRAMERSDWQLLDTPAQKAVATVSMILT